MTDAQFMTMLRNQAKHPPRDADRPRYRYDDGSAERDYYRAMLESRGVDANKIVDLMPGNYSHRRTLWLKAAWNVIKTKRGTPYLVEAKAEPAEPAYVQTQRDAWAKKLAEASPEVREALLTPGPKKRGRPFGSKNKPKLVAEPVKPAEQPKPSKPRVPSHYLSTASRVAYHAAM
jgi:hypothetical protein